MTRLDSLVEPARALGISRAPLLVLLLITTLVAFPASTQTVEPREGDTVGWHIVEQGETLEGITGKYLGNPALWPEIFRLNRDIIDPDVLLPGQRIRVILERNTPSFALVT